ncbi:2OG-Fe(II) oxygenase family protein [Asticcacaulis sp. YBE204]|uniref:2OG-Fe(II) oxygenase family protein n=1 Tax=Asticcacaulis sp. YBE204 TaxID=1282363 RepID=UPI0004CEF21D|nr:2OG-Fe(II) oxygenase family protein [Asticcacaulis sp. YBE204]
MSLTLRTDAFDFAGFQNRFAQKGRIRLEGALPHDDAHAIHHALEQETLWELHLVNSEGAPDVISRTELESLNPSEIQDRLAAAAERAQTGLSFLHLGYDLTTKAALENLGDDHPVFELAKLVWSQDFADFCEQVTGLTGLKLQSLIATGYRPGDFFTMHTDAAAKLSFEWNFTHDWRSDWGGQILFHSPSGDIEGGIMPRLNDLSLYAGDQPRSIASLAAYAGAPRFAITGRFI